MFFEVHRNSVIGYKKLSNADLGLSLSSNQTHIGLFEDSLSFLNNVNHDISIATLIYESTAKQLLCPIDYIKNSNGSFRSPKIRKGNRSEIKFNENSIVMEIREIVSNNSASNDWHLIWFGLSNNTLVFMLFQSGTIDYYTIQQICGDLNRGNITIEDSRFHKIINFLNHKINESSYDYLEELEDSVLSDTIELGKKFNQFDLQKTKQLLSTIGFQGEQAIDHYLNKLKFDNQIKDYNWVNKSVESYLPFDFEVIDINNKKIFTDVKSTNNRFQQKIYFSKQELEFINSVPGQYQLQRVYNLNEIPYLKVCNNTNTLANYFTQIYNPFNNSLKQNDFGIQNLNISVKPTNGLLNFGNEIAL